MTPGEAAGVVRTARVLRTGVLPNTAAALAAGAICGAHARVIADGVIDAPAGAVALIEPEAVAAAAEADVRAVANLMRAFGHALDRTRPTPPRSAATNGPRLTFSPTLDGSMAISGLADEVTGALIATAVDTAGPVVTGDSRTRPDAGWTGWPRSPAATSPTPTHPAAAAAGTPT